jgi:hypothetical protein
VNPNSLSRLTSARPSTQQHQKMLRGERREQGRRAATTNDAEKGSRQAQTSARWRECIRSLSIDNKAAGTCHRTEPTHRSAGARRPPKNSAALANRARGVSTARPRQHQEIHPLAAPRAVRPGGGAAPRPDGCLAHRHKTRKEKPQSSAGLCLRTWTFRLPRAASCCCVVVCTRGGRDFCEVVSVCMSSAGFLWCSV